MSEFQFARSQRVIVPAQEAGGDNIQGIVVAQKAFIGREPEYTVVWPLADTVGEDLRPVIVLGFFSESILLAAQPARMIEADKADAVVRAARQETADEIRREYADRVSQLERQISRLERTRRSRRR